MAITKSLLVETVFGDQRVQVYDVSPGAANTSFSTGLNKINFTQVTIKSMTTDGTMGAFFENELPAGTAAAGDISMSNVVTDGVYRIVVYGSS